MGPSFHFVHCDSDGILSLVDHVEMFVHLGMIQYLKVRLNL